MTRTFAAVVEHGVLRPKEPLNLADGQEVTVTLPEPRMSNEDFERALAAAQAAAREYSDEWWNDFDRELRENRMNFEERV
jgi:predicted DNA-binding antitoxin AbrB/MazE fold protein